MMQGMAMWYTVGFSERYVGLVRSGSAIEIALPSVCLYL